jgi:hypothetical protein
MPGIGAVDVYVNGLLVSTALPPRETTPFLSLPPGQYNVAVYPAGSDPLAVPAADLLLDLPPGESKSAVVYETRFAASAPTNAEDEGTPRPQPVFAGGLAQSGSIMILNDNRSPMPLGKTRLTAVHLALGNPGRLSVAYPSRASLLHEVALEQPYGDIDIDAGVYPLTLVDAESAALDRLAFIGEQVFQANVHYTLIMIPDVTPTTEANSSGLTLPPLADRPTLFVVNAPLEPPIAGIQLRVIHAAHSTDLVDVYIDGQLVVPRLTYSEYTPYLGLASYSHLIELRRRDADPESTPLATAQFNITEENQAQRHWTLMLLNGNQLDLTSLEVIQAQEPIDAGSNAPTFFFNTVGGPMSLVILPDNIAQTQRGFSRVRVIHAIDGALEIGLLALGIPRDEALPTPTPNPGTPVPEVPIPLVRPVIYGVEANESEVPAGVYEELDFVAGSSTDISQLFNHQLLAGMVHTFVLVGQPAGEPPIRVLELIDHGRGLPSQRLYIGLVTTQEDLPARVRLRPTIASGVTGQLLPGTEVEVLGRNADATWARISYIADDSGIPREGWIAMQLVQVTRLGEPINPLALPQIQ